MAKPIQFGLVLEGQDAIDFEEYCKNPTYTKTGRMAMQEALRRIDEENKNTKL